MSDSKTPLLHSTDDTTTITPDPPPAYSDKPQTQQRTPLPRPPPLSASLPILTSLRSKRVILASQSPRRRQILSQLGLPRLEIIPSNTPEDFPKSLDPFEYVLATATQKATTVYEAEIARANRNADANANASIDDTDAKAHSTEEPALILAADTIVVDTSSGTILEKPRSEAQHIAMLKALRDNGVHKVFTAMAAMAPLASARVPGYALETAIEETSVLFDAGVSDETIMAYVRTREGADKAGGYGLQGLGSILVERIEGSWDNVVGLPLRAALKLIESVLVKADDEEEDEDGDGEEGSESEE